MRFSEYFSVIWGFSIAIHIPFTIIYQVIFWVLANGPQTVACAPLSASFPTRIKPLVTPLYILNTIKRCSTFWPVTTESIRGHCPSKLFLFLTNPLVYFYKEHDHNQCIIKFYTPVASFFFPLAQHYRCHHSDVLSIFWISAIQRRLTTWFPPSLQPGFMVWGGKYTFKVQDLYFMICF